MVGNVTGRGLALQGPRLISRLYEQVAPTVTWLTQSFVIIIAVRSWWHGHICIRRTCVQRERTCLLSSRRFFAQSFYAASYCVDWYIQSPFFLWALANTAIVNVINKIVHCFAVTIFSRFHAFNEKSRLTKTNHSERYIHGKMHDWDLSRVYSKLKWEAKFQEYPSEFSRNIPSVIGATPSNKNLDIPCSFLFAAILRSKCKCKSGALRRWQLW